ncbi:MAG: hypothetical protein AAGD05_01215 [Bacteroidota bacterium]
MIQQLSFYTKLKKAIPILFFFLCLTITSCSDGMQIGQKIHSVIDENKISMVVITTERNDGTTRSTEWATKNILIDNQFLQAGDEYINLGLVKTLKVNGSKLEIRI